MLQITLEIDVRSFENQVDEHMAKAFQPAVVAALNAAGEAAVRAVRKGMLTDFDRPNPFTLEGVDFYKAAVRTNGGDPSASSTSRTGRPATSTSTSPAGPGAPVTP